MSNNIITRRLIEDRNSESIDVFFREITVDLGLLCNNCGDTLNIELNRVQVINLHQDLGDWLHDERVKK